MEGESFIKRGSFSVCLANSRTESSTTEYILFDVTSQSPVSNMARSDSLTRTRSLRGELKVLSIAVLEP